MGTKRTKIINSYFHSVIIATFSAWKNGERTPTNGMIEPLISFFGKRTEEITLIDCPHPGSDNIVPKIEIYNNGILQKQKKPLILFPPLFILKRFNEIKTQPTFKIRDFFTVFQTVLFKKTRIDLFIGLESINTLVGILFKKIGNIKTVVYYVSDYSPNRYSSKTFNKIYLWLDRFCAMNADYIWDVSKAMMPARIKSGLRKEKAKPAIHVPNALFPSQIKYAPINRLEPFSLVFAGTIGPENGLDLAIESFAIARKKLPQLKLHILGSGLQKDEIYAKLLIKRLKIEHVVTYHGFISDLTKLSEILMHYMVGLAPYRAIPWSVRWYADATKIRLYFANGLPVVTTQVPPLGKEAQEKGCAIVTNDNKEEFSDAIIQMISDKNNYKKYREAATEFAKHNTWENTYTHALQLMRIET